jgi:hypothetical protein
MALHAKGVERRDGLFVVKAPAVDLDQVFDDVGGSHSLPRNERRQASEQFSVGEQRELFHALGLSRCFSSLPVTSTRRFTRAITFEAVVHAKELWRAMAARSELLPERVCQSHRRYPLLRVPRAT